MSILVFERPSNGAVLDVKELEYISALHQSGNKIRSDGTIEARCISHLLMSRHGIKIDDLAYIEQAIVQDLAGDTHSKARSCLDIPQLTALLLIPFLRKLQEKGEEYQKESIFGQTLSIILNDVAYHSKRGGRQEEQARDGTAGPLLTKDLLREIFATYGERDVSDIHLERMIQHAGGDEIQFNQETFMTALTRDVETYNVEWDESMTTHLNDFLSIVDGGLEELETPLEKREPRISSASTEPSDEDALSLRTARPMLKVGTMPTIDLTADTFTYSLFFILLFLSAIISFLSYFGGYEYFTCDDSSFGCEVALAITNWLSFVVWLGGLGSTYMIFASAGNSSVSPSPWYFQLGGMLLVICMLILPFYGKFPIPVVEVTEDEWLSWAPYLCLVIGGVLLAFQIVILVQTLSRTLWSKVNASTMILIQEHHTKTSANHKAKGLVEHALALHEDNNPEQISDKRLNHHSLSSMHSPQKRALLNYQSKLNDREQIGGFWWTWRSIYCADLCRLEGIWLGARLGATFVGLLLALFGFVYVFGWAISFVKNEYNDSPTQPDTFALSLEGGVRSLYFNSTGSFLYTAAEASEDFLAENNLEFAYVFDQGLEIYRETFKSRLVRSFLEAFEATKEVTTILGIQTADSLVEQFSDRWYNATGLDLERTVEYVHVYASFEGGLLEFAYEQAKDSFTEKHILAAVVWGGCAGTFSMLCIFLAYVPSAVSQTLMYRSGFAMAPLTDKDFAALKSWPWFSTMMFGEALWGSFVSGVLCAVANGCVLLLFLWEETSSYALSVLAAGIGLLVAYLFKKVVLSSFRQLSHSGLLRQNPALSNVVTIALECWNIGISLGFVLSRAIKMILMACAYIGRVDVPFAAKHVSIFGLKIDEDFLALHTDLLLHEAHRHPYMERLALLYMVKAYKGRGFATREGSSWRLLFVLALMPWIHRYRHIHEKPIEEVDLAESSNTDSSLRARSIQDATIVLVGNEVSA